MQKKKLLKTIVLLMFGIFLADKVADNFHLYDTTIWVSMIMHSLGGFWVSLFFLYVFHDKLPKKRHLFVIVSCVILIGVAWEFFEYAMNLISKDPMNWPDTLFDLFFDTVGGLGAIYYNESHAKHS